MEVCHGHGPERLLNIFKALVANHQLEQRQLRSYLTDFAEKDLQRLGYRLPQLICESPIGLLAKQQKRALANNPKNGMRGAINQAGNEDQAAMIGSSTAPKPRRD
jgi:hypothetical protein